MSVLQKLSEEEAYLVSLLTDPSGIDQMEFMIYDPAYEDGLFRSWPVQVSWWRNRDPLVISQGSRSVGKSLSCCAAALAFPFCHPGEEMVITAPESVHLQALTDKIETMYRNNRIPNEMLIKGITGIKHKPYLMNFRNGARVMGRIPQRSGTGVKGCTIAGTLVLTRDRGLIEVENVTTQDFVWSHLQRWTPVVDTYELEGEAYVVKGQGAFELTVSSDHRFYARNDVSPQPGKRKRQLGQFTWEWPDNFSSSRHPPINVYWTSVRDFGETLDVPLPDFSRCKRAYEINDDFWWVIGRMLADGSFDKTAVQISVHPDGHEEVFEHLLSCGMDWRINPHPDSSAETILVHSTGLASWLREHFGHRAEGKTVPTWVLTMPENSRRGLLEGYLSGDGCAHPHGNQMRVTSSSASKKLTLGMGTLGQTLNYNIGYSKVDVKITEIMGVPLKKKPFDSFRCSYNVEGRGVFDRDGFVSYKIHSSEKQEGFRKFYGIVTGDHSYWADGVIHHNTHPTVLIQDECFPAGTLVLTKQGYSEIEKIEVGTEVWTHKNRWRKVTKTFDRGLQDMVRVRGMGHPGLTCSSNHKFWIMSEADKSPSMKPANEIKPGDYWATPTRVDFLPDIPIKDGWQALFNGFIYGEGDYTTTSKRLALELADLANILDFQGVEVYLGDLYYTVRMSLISDETYVCDEKRWRRIRSVEPLDEQMDCFDLEVEEDHSFLVEGNFCSNSQDYPEAGWSELIETVRQGVEDSQWKAFGVTRGVRDKFFEYTNSDAWTVFRLPAMFRPTWTDEERALKEKQYGGAASQDYRRNVLGLHGDSTSSIFTAAALGKVIDTNQSSFYNESEYWSIEINETHVDDIGGDIVPLIDPPSTHSKYRNFWLGMDVGFCVDEQTEILTKRGWRKYNEIIIGVDESLAINPETHKSEWQTITDLYVDTGNFPMVSMKGQSFDSCTTPHHRWFIQNSSGHWKWKTTETLNSKEKIPLAVGRGDAPSIKVFSDDFVELVAWVFTEGSYLGYDSFDVSQSIVANPSNTERILALFSRLFGKPGFAKDGARWRKSWRFDNTMLYAAVQTKASREIGLSGVFLNLREKELDPQFLVSLTLDQLNLFLEVCNLGDGWVSDGGHCKIEQRSLARIKNFEMACALAGKACSTSRGPNDERDRWHTSVLDSQFCWPVAAANMPSLTDQGMTIQRDDHFFGTIWCPTLKGHNWLARRNGSIYFTGNTIAPSAIVIFSEVSEKGKDPMLKLLGRILMRRIKTMDQAAAIIHLIDTYRPLAFAMDSTGVGLPLLELIQDQAKNHPELGFVVERIRGYNFSQKIVADFDDTVEVDPDDPLSLQKSEIRRSVLEHSTDVLRTLVDEQRLQLPWDTELIGEFQGQAVTYSRDALDPYGRKKLFSSGFYHSLDACRMAALAYKQNAIEQLLKNQEDTWSPPSTLFL